jgi:hypothetical protein
MHRYRKVNYAVKSTWSIYLCHKEEEYGGEELHDT